MAAGQVLADTSKGQLIFQSFNPPPLGGTNGHESGNFSSERPTAARARRSPHYSL